MAEAIIVVSTFQDEGSAKEVAEKLVREGAAACATMFPVRSVYVWDGSLQDSPEHMVLFKTTSGNGPRLRNRILECHPYDTPEIMQIPAEGVHGPYLEWLAGSVR